MIDRYSSNDPAGTNAFIIPFYKWKGLFENECADCSPSYSIVDDMTSTTTNAPVSIDADLNIRVDTSNGLSFSGYLKAYYPSSD